MQFDPNCFEYLFHHIIQCTRIQKFLSIFSSFLPDWHIIYPIKLWIIQSLNIFFQQFQKPCTVWCVWEILCIHQCGIFFLKNICRNELFIWLMYVVWNFSTRICLEKNLFTLVRTIIFLSLRYYLLLNCERWFLW